MRKIIAGFRDFITRGNVIDLAVAVVIGAAFTALVTAFTEDFINPLIQAITGGKGKVGGTFTINGARFDYGGFITAIITFLLTAAVVYFCVVTPMNIYMERRRRGLTPEPEAPAEDIVLLREIRDLLAGQNGTTGRASQTDARRADGGPQSRPGDLGA